MGKWTRRAFITTGVLAGGAIVFGVAIRPGNRNAKVSKLVAAGEETVINIWLKIAADNTITAIIPHAEMGQGVHTTLAMMLADELEADWNNIRIQEAPAHREYANYAMVKGFLAGEINFPSFLVDTMDGVFLTASKVAGLQLTGGSFSVAMTGVYGMRVAGAAAKAVLLQAAAEEWQVLREELVAEKSYIHHHPSNRSAPFASFASRAGQLNAPAKTQLKSDQDFRIMGTSPPRFDIPAKVDGTAQFGLDVNLPGMKYATVKASPVFGRPILSVDSSLTVEKPGVHKVIAIGDAVAVVADSYWQAKTAAEVLIIEYAPGAQASVSQQDIFKDFEELLNNGKTEVDVKTGNIEKAMPQADVVYEAEYRVPYLAHATMEPMNCTAWVHDDICEIWIGCQNPLGFAREVAKAIGFKDEKVILHNQLLGGGFGRRGFPDVAIQAAQIAMEVDAPVKLIWSREEDMRHDHYRQATVARLKAGLDASGKPMAWEHKFIDKHDPADAPKIPYAIENQLIHYTESANHIPWGYWRSVDHSVHAFFTESFIDELAYQAQMDPYQFRRELLVENLRFRNVLDLAAEKAGWDQALPAGWGRGMAIHQSFGTIVAQVVEAEVIADKIKVHRVVCVADAGFAIHPDGFTAQMESGIIFGLTAALYGEITIKDGAVLQSNFHDYPMVRMHEAPAIETHILNSGHRIGGAGEPGTPPIAPALANAIFDATGKRLRNLPFRFEDLS